MNKSKRMISVLLLIAIMILNSAMCIIFANAEDEGTTVANEYYVAFSNQNYAIRNSNKMELGEDGDYYLEKVSLTSLVDFYVTDKNGVKYYSASGNEMTVDETASYRYNIRFSPDKLFDTEDAGYKATACHVTYAFYIPETYSVKINEDEQELTYNPYFTSYDLYYISSVKLTAGSTISYGEGEEAETHNVSSDGYYRILFTPTVVSDGNEYAFDIDGNYGSGDDYVYNLYVEDAPLYYAVFDEGASEFTCQPTTVIDGNDAYLLTRYENNATVEEYRLSDLFINLRDASLKYRIYEEELTGNYRLIDDDNDEDTNVSKITVSDVGWYELSFVATNGSYSTDAVWSARELDGYYIVGEFNGYGFNKSGGVDIDEKFLFTKVEEGDDDYNDEYEQYILYLTITKKDLADDNVEFYISDGENKYKNGTEYISLNTAGKYKILFSDEHVYSQGRRYRYTLLDGKESEREIEISTADEFIEFAKACSESADYSISLSVYLTGDLDFSGKEFVPVRYFSGEFYGGYHTISGITAKGDGDCLAVFETVTRSGKIERLNVELTLNGKDADYVGFAGKNYGTLQKITVSGSILGGNYTGGIAAFNGVSRVDDNSASLDSNNVVQTGVIDGCVNNAAVTGESNVGGVTGFNSGDVLSCQNNGNVTPSVNTKNNLTNIGGIAGFSAGKLSDCENDGNVGVNSYAVYVGGVVGFCTGENYFLVNRGTVAGRKYVGGVAGGYGNITQNADDRDDFFGGMSVEEIINQYFTADDDSDEILVGERHDMFYLQNYAPVTAGSYVAGILATSEYTELVVQNSVSLGDITATGGGYAGGIVGNGSITVRGCSSSGKIKASGTSANYVGGIIGNGGTVIACSSVADLFGSDYIGGIAGNVTGYVASSYTSVNIVADDDKKNVGGIAGFVESFNASLNSFPTDFKYNYYVDGGSFGGVAGTEYGKNFEYAAAAISEEKLISEGNLSAYLNQYFDHEYWQGGKANSYPVLSYMYECFDIEDIDNEEQLFKKHTENLQAATEQCAKITYSVVFMEWNKDNGDLYDDGKIAYGNFEEIATFKVGKGDSIASVALKYAELRDGRYVYEGDDKIYFVTLKSVENANGNVVIYAEYTPAITTVATDDGTVLVEGLFDADTRITLEKTGDYYRIKFSLNGEELNFSDYSVKFRKPDAEKKYTVYKITEEKTKAQSSVSGDYLVFTLNGEFFEIHENVIASLTSTEIGLIIALCAVFFVAIVSIIIFSVRKCKKKKAEKQTNEQA